MTERRAQVSIAVLTNDIKSARCIAEDILKSCLDNGCYTDVYPFDESGALENEMEKRQFSVLVLQISVPDELERLRRLKNDNEDLRFVVLTESPEIAVESYTLPADFCTHPTPSQEDIKRIVSLCFST